jgi:predicted DNA-binding ribbon-helix-helix protein
MNANLVRRNVTIGGRRTSLRLEREFWVALEEVCRREGLSLHRLCTVIDRRRATVSRTSAVRSFVMAYFQSAAASVETGNPTDPGISEIVAEAASTAAPDQAPS